MDRKNYIHRLFDNTDFYNLFFGLDDCENYYFSNNLIDEHLSKRYKNSSFKYYGEPTYKKYLFGIWCEKWPLDYRSTFVFPIRYIPSYDPPNPDDKEVNKDWQYYGFLCIDCNRKGIFDIRHQNDIGAAFADILYLFISQVYTVIRSQKQKLEGVNDGQEA